MDKNIRVGVNVDTSSVADINRLNRETRRSAEELKTIYDRIAQSATRAFGQVPRSLQENLSGLRQAQASSIEATRTGSRRAMMIEGKDYVEELRSSIQNLREWSLDINTSAKETAFLNRTIRSLKEELRKANDRLEKVSQPDGGAGTDGGGRLAGISRQLVAKTFFDIANQGIGIYMDQYRQSLAARNQAILASTGYQSTVGYEAAQQRMAAARTAGMGSLAGGTMSTAGTALLFSGNPYAMAAGALLSIGGMGVNFLTQRSAAGQTSQADLQEAIRMRALASVSQFERAAMMNSLITGESYGQVSRNFGRGANFAALGLTNAEALSLRAQLAGFSRGDYDPSIDRGRRLDDLIGLSRRFNIDPGSIVNLGQNLSLTQGGSVNTALIRTINALIAEGKNSTQIQQQIGERVQSVSQVISRAAQSGYTMSEAGANRLISGVARSTGLQGPALDRAVRGLTRTGTDDLTQYAMLRLARRFRPDATLPEAEAIVKQLSETEPNLVFNYMKNIASQYSGGDRGVMQRMMLTAFPGADSRLLLGELDLQTGDLKKGLLDGKLDFGDISADRRKAEEIGARDFVGPNIVSEIKISNEYLGAGMKITEVIKDNTSEIVSALWRVVRQVEKDSEGKHHIELTDEQIEALSDALEVSAKSQRKS